MDEHDNKTGSQKQGGWTPGQRRVMASDRISTDYRARVWDDEHGYYAEVRPDRDGLGLCEFAYSDTDAGAKEVSFCISWSMAAALADALKQIALLNGDGATHPTGADQ